MLVLNRKNGETIAIGNGITITLVKGRHGSAKIGIDAPAEVPIFRTEVIDAARDQLGGEQTEPEATTDAAA